MVRVVTTHRQPSATQQGCRRRTSVFDTLGNAISAGDAQLCQWMALGHQGDVEDNTMEARRMIASLEEQREELARHTARQLLAWLGMKGVRRFPLTTHEVRTRIRHAGLDRILARLQEMNPPHGKAVRIGRLLCGAGARPEPVRQALQLTCKELKGVKGAGLADLLLSQETADRLELGGLKANPMTAAHEASDPNRTQLRRERAGHWHRADMDNRRFGYDRQHPAWKYMRLPVPARERMKQLEYLGKAPEAQCKGLDLQLP